MPPLPLPDLENLVFSNVTATAKLDEQLQRKPDIAACETGQDPAQELVVLV